MSENFTIMRGLRPLSPCHSGRLELAQLLLRNLRETVGGNTMNRHVVTWLLAIALFYVAGLFVAGSGYVG